MLLKYSMRLLVCLKKTLGLLPYRIILHRNKAVVLMCVFALHCAVFFSIYQLLKSSSDKLYTPLDTTVQFPWKPITVPDVDCSKLFDGDPAERHRAKNVTRKISPDSDVTDEVSEAGCEAFVHRHGFITSSLTKEESDFPLAYSLLVYKTAAQVRQLLQAIYRPHNFICIHVDLKSTPAFRKAVESMARCLDNVFVSSRSVKVRWGSFSVLEPELICMEDLLRHKAWKYFINLTGQEFPLKTNLEIVRILKAVRGANLVAGDRDSTWQQRRWRDKAPAPHNLTVVKGAVHVAVNRHFVHFAVNSPVARDLREWCRDIVIPDEQFFPTLNHNPQLGIPGSYAGTSSVIKPKLVRYKNWDPSTCAGKRTRGICILSVGDLPLLGERLELFANKFHAGYSSLASECLAERLYNHTRDETLGRRKVDVSFYESLPFLDNIVDGGSL